MKILYISPYYKPSWYFGGPPRCISEQAELLKKEYGYEIDVLTLNLNGNKKLVDSSKIVSAEINGIHVHYLPHFNTPFFNYYFSSMLFGFRKKLKQYQLIHIHGVFNAFSSIGMQMASAAGIPFILTPHGMLDKWCLKKSYVAKIIHKYIFEKRLLKKAHTIHFTTVGEQLNSIYPPEVKSDIIPYLLNLNSPNGHDRDYIYGNNKTIRMVFFGRINHKKGLLQLIHAISELTDLEKQYLSFDIYGNDEDNHLQKILAAIEKYSLEKVIVYKGFLEPENRLLTLKNYDLMVLLSYQENFGITVLEALEAGIPVFISDKVNVSDWIEKYDCGWVTNMEKESIILNLKKILMLDQHQINIKGRNNTFLFKQEMDQKTILSAYKRMYENAVR
jgi:glycosyltransferase involved in cell wall biosynthesis